MHPFDGRPGRQSLLSSLLAFGSLSCASLDPTADLDGAAALVSAHSGLAAEWTGPWGDVPELGLSERPLSADEAARVALRHQPKLRAAVESIVQARADVVQAHLLPNPVLNFTLGFPVDGGPGNPAMGSLLQPLTALWRRPARIDAADARLRAAVLAVSDAGLRVVAEAKAAHARLVFAERDLSLEQESLRDAEEALVLVERLLDAGEAMRLDRNRAALDRSAAEVRVTEARVRRDAARREILAICGAAGSASLPWTDDLPVAVPDGFGEMQERDLVNLAEVQRLDLAASRVLMEGEMDGLRLAELRRFPDLSIGPGYQGNFTRRRAFGPALALSLPIFDDGRAQVAKAGSMARAAAAEIERVRQGAIAEVRRAWVELRGALSNLERQRDEVLAFAVDSRRQAEESLAAGVIDRGALLGLRLRELRARLAVSAMERSAVEWFIELERAVGGRLMLPDPVDGAGPRDGDQASGGV